MGNKKFYPAETCDRVSKQNIATEVKSNSQYVCLSNNVGVETFCTVQNLLVFMISIWSMKIDPQNSSSQWNLIACTTVVLITTLSFIDIILFNSQLMYNVTTPTQAKYTHDGIV